MMVTYFPRVISAMALGAALVAPLAPAGCAKGGGAEDTDDVGDAGPSVDAPSSADVTKQDAGVVVDSAADLDTAVPVDTGACPPPASCHPVINEVKVAGPTSASDEMVEIYSPCAQTFSLTGWTLVYRSDNGTTDVDVSDLKGHSLTQASPYLLLVGSGYAGGGTTDGTFTSGFGANGGGLALKNGTTIVDSMGYGTATNAFVRGAPATVPSASSNMTMSRIPNGCDHGQNDVDFVMRAATPRAPN
jgi:hypothetical protein